MTPEEVCRLIGHVTKSVIELEPMVMVTRCHTCGKEQRRELVLR